MGMDWLGLVIFVIIVGAIFAWKHFKNKGDE